ncbi:sigma-70 family RNA polymerase sigma factor [bacterium BMS3Abin03]|nr:sigma-70 family RNA polymerase sigma factor [bacterium BMS3Abin03]
MSDKFSGDKPDSELISAFKNGDITGFNEIVRRYQQQVYWVIRKMVNSHDDADDLTQEVFIKIYSALKDFREESNLFTWLYRIATNYSINHIRKAKVRNTVSFEIVTEQVESKEKKSDEAVDEKTKMKLLIEAIETLPAQQRAVFNLRYNENLSYEDISKVMKKSVGGVKANYFHAVKKLGDYLKTRMRMEN